MTKVWSCERLQRRCHYCKILECLWPVNQAQPTWNCALELLFPQRRAGGCSCLWRLAESLCSSWCRCEAAYLNCGL